MYDAETNKVIAEAEALEAMFKSSGWEVAEASLLQTIADLENVTTLDMSDPNLTQQVRDRINTVAALKQWVADLRGRVNNVIIMQDKPTASKLETRR